MRHTKKRININIRLMKRFASQRRKYLFQLGKDPRGTYANSN